MSHPFGEAAFADDGDGDVLPALRSCRTATTIAHRRAQRALRRASAKESTIAAVAVAVADDATVKSCGGNSAYVSLQDEQYSDDDTILSSNLHQYANVQARKEEERHETALGDVLCCSLTEAEGTLADLAASFRQILFAFVISPEDVDALAGTIDEARVEVMELELERRWSSVRELERQLSTCD